MSIQTRLRRLERIKMSMPTKIYVFRVGNHESCHFGSEEEYYEELQKPKYENAIVIRDLDHWV
ncbi:hypothetical protein [Virgibacillus sp. YIM 98842]|uniref:hypothetical protein n=1 Tax=Virgibacillus sp. YIM 98842 TaxID=2663533 RepID=UPI0013DAB9E0|nr:hypothetical protein [Virgibacillus sp. YIM 98842]